jgi:excisionase family DNA binding protein
MRGAGLEAVGKADDACDWLKCSKSTLYRLVREEGLPVVRLGKDLRFRPADIEKWLDGRLSNGAQ